MRTLSLMAFVVACGGDPHADFVTPPNTFDADFYGPLDNLVLNPNLTLPRYINGVGVGSSTWDIVHDVDMPSGQPAIQGAGRTSALFRMVRSPMQAEVWVSSTSLEPAEVVVLYTDVDTLKDSEVALPPVEERIIESRRWTRYAGPVPAGDGLGLLIARVSGEGSPRVSAPVVRPDEAAEGLRSARFPSQPADERWRAIYPEHRPYGHETRRR